MNAREVLASLHKLCSDLDKGRPLRRIVVRKMLIPIAVPAALGLAMGAPACGPMHADYGPEPEADEVCDNGVDDDDDGLVDCDDEECYEVVWCEEIDVSVYSVPMPDPENCANGIDDDGDSDIDCADSDCDDFIDCRGDYLYGVPFEENCSDGIDNDGDGSVDCDDIDCADACRAVPMYGDPFPEPEPMEDCCDGVDNDGDGLVDCLDEECVDEPSCAIIAYGFPMESDCADGRDNDCDGFVDCDDEDCAAYPDCDVD